MAFVHGCASIQLLQPSEVNIKLRWIDRPGDFPVIFHKQETIVKDWLQSTVTKYLFL